MIIEFYLELNDDMRYRDQFQDVCQAWVKGKLPYEISAEKELDISEIDDLCSKRISYELNFLIGNICDLIVIDEENDEQVDPRNTLMIFTRKSEVWECQILRRSLYVRKYLMIGCWH